MTANSGPGQGGDRPGLQELARLPGRDDQSGAGGQNRGEEAVGHPDACVLPHDLDQTGHNHFLSAEEAGRPSCRQGADPEPDGMSPGTQFSGAGDHLHEAPSFLSAGPLVLKLGTPDDDQPFQFHSITSSRLGPLTGTGPCRSLFSRAPSPPWLRLPVPPPLLIRREATTSIRWPARRSAGR